MSDDLHKLAETTLAPKAHEAFLKSLDEARAKQATMLDVVATPYEQAGQEILVGTCPACNTIAALSGEGKHQCRCCHSWLNYHRA